MAAIPSPGDETPIYSALGKMLVKWNMADRMMQWLVVWLYNLGDKGEILTAHMGSVTMADALKTLATEFSDDEVRPHVLHFISLMDRIRGYRNYFAHGISIVGFLDDGAAIGYLQQTQARGQLMSTSEHITVARIDAVTEHCIAAHLYASAISVELIRRAGHDMGDLPPLALREKPPLPPQLTKPHVRRLGPRPPQQA